MSPYFWIFGKYIIIIIINLIHEYYYISIDGKQINRI